jgi:Ca2+-binding RTX toxin-like protein
MTTRITIPHRIAALAAVAAGSALVLPASASAAVTGSVSGNSAVLTGDAAADTIIISQDNGLLRNNLGFSGGPTDFDSNVDGAQTLTTAATLEINGGGGDDIIVGGPAADHLIGGDGNDRLTGFTGADDVDGGPGNDVMIWNNGDGNDTNDGEAGVDESLITGRNTTDDMTVVNTPGGRVLFSRAAPGPFTVDMGTVERLSLTPFAGDDKLVTAPDVTLPISVAAGPGLDNITTGAGVDLIEGGEDVDALNGGAGGDRILGNPGNDLMNGNAGNDTLVWNNGDGTDDMNGEEGLDRIETNLGAADDVSQVKVENGKVRYDRINPGPFGLNIATSEVLELNTFGGNDTLDVAPGVGALIAITADAGDGDDRFNGGDEADTFFGGLGNDSLNGGAGSDSVDGQDGDDSLSIRDGAADLARGGAGTDSATVDSIDAVAEVENVDRAKSGANALSIAREAKVTAKKGKKYRGKGRFRAQLALTCDASAAEGCKGTLTLLTARTVRIGGVKVQALLASVRYDLAAGESANVTVKLPAVAKQLAKRGSLKVKAQAVALNAAGDLTTKTSDVTLKFKR